MAVALRQLNPIHQKRGHKVFFFPSSSHIIEKNYEDIMQHLEEEASSDILTNIFDEERSDSDSQDDT